MEKLVDVLAARKGELRFPEIVDLCREHSLFARLVGEDDDDLDRGKKNVFSRILSKFDGRIFATGATFRVQRRSKNVVRFLCRTRHARRGHSGHSGHFYPLYRTYPTFLEGPTIDLKHLNDLLSR